MTSRLIAPTALEASAGPNEAWRLTHMGRLLGHALRRFDARVMQLLARSAQAPMALSNLASREQVSAAHIHLLRHLPLAGTTNVALAHSAGMSKQAMADVLSQCEAWGLIARQPDPSDRRAKRVVFTDTGLAWLGAFEAAVQQAEREMAAEVGPEVAAVLSMGLEAYANGS